MNSFIKNILYSTVIILIVGIFPFLLWWKEFWIELSLAYFISLINAAFGYYFAIISIDKPDNDFYKNVYGGMLIRMLFVFGLSIFIITNNFVLMTPYMLFLLLFYVIHQWSEIFGWMKELPNTKVQIN